MNGVVTMIGAPSRSAFRSAASDREDSVRAPVTAIVPSYNEESASVARTLCGLVDQAWRPERIVVVDDASPQPPQVDGVLARQITMMRMPENVGVSAARNHAAVGGRTDYLLFVNCDVALASDWVERAVEFMAAHPRAGAVSGRIIPQRGRPVLREWRLQHIETKVHRVTLTTPVRQDWLVGHVMLVRRTAFEEVGGFDAEYRRAGEDPDLCQRLAGAGWDIFHLPALTAASYESATIASLARKCVRNSGWNLRRQCAPCKAVKPLRPIPATAATVRLLGEHVLRDLLRGRLQFLPVDLAVAAHSIGLVWTAAARA